MGLVAFDLDGTLFHTPHGTDFESADALRAASRPIPDAVARVCALVRRGHRVAYITGRCHHVRAVTQVQIMRYGLPPGRLVTQDRWQGYDVMAGYKAGALAAVEAALYVGDHEADREAARIAGIPFVHADDFRAVGLVMDDESARCEHGAPYYGDDGSEAPCGDCGRG